MSSKSSEAASGALERGSSGKALVAIAILAVALGTFFRAYHVDRKVYDGDEVYSSLRMLGDAEAPLVADAPQLHDVRALWAIVHPDPPAGANGPLAVIATLVREEPQQAPLYFEFGHFWIRWFGNSISAVRSMSVAAGLLGLPCAFWFGLELYRSRAAAWMGLALFALSPVQIVYAQQAREYALWSTLLLACGAAMLRALRLDRARPWWLAGILLALAFYAHPLTLPVAAGFAGSVVLTRWRERAVLARCGLAFGGALLAYAPWLTVIFANLHAVQRSLGSVLEAKLSLLEIVRALAGSLKLNFIDLGFSTSSAFGIVSTGIVLAVIAGVLVFNVRHEPRSRWLFLVLPILLSTVPFMLADLLFSGQRIRQTRYFIPCYLFGDYLLVGALAAWVGVRGGLRAWSAAIAMSVLLLVRLVSCAAGSRAFTWWSTEWDDSIAVAAAVNQTREPVLVSDDYLVYSLVLANYLRPEIKVALRPRCYLCIDRVPPRIDAGTLPQGPFTDAFALGPSPELQRLLPAWAARAGADYHCVNVRHNCVSTLNVEPLFEPSSAKAPGAN